MITRSLTAVLLVGFALTGCGGESAPSPAPATSGASATASASGPAASPVAPSPTADAVQTIEVTVAGGEVVGGLQTVDVPLGTDFRLVVTSDVADEIHLHGYDVTVDVAAGGSATLGATATIPGVVVAEVEDSGLTIIKIATQ